MDQKREDKKMATSKVQFIITVGCEDIEVMKERLDENAPSHLLANGDYDSSLETMQTGTAYRKAHAIPTADFPARLFNELELEEVDGEPGETWCTYRAQDEAHVYTVRATFKGMPESLAWANNTEAAVFKLVLAALREVQEQTSLNVLTTRPHY
jgi:hypothetical protein